MIIKLSFVDTTFQKFQDFESKIHEFASKESEKQDFHPPLAVEQGQSVIAYSRAFGRWTRGVVHAANRYGTSGK